MNSHANTGFLSTYNLRMGKSLIPMTNYGMDVSVSFSETAHLIFTHKSFS